MRRWPIKSLGDLVDFRGGGTPRRDNADYWNGNIPWASVKDMKNQTLEATLETITTKGLESSASNLIPKGTVIIASRVGLGKVAINRMPVAINQDLKALIPKTDELIPRYLLFFLLSKSEYFERAGVGATVKGLTIGDYQKLNISLPSPQEQQRIVKLLDEADELRKLRAQADQRTDDLIPSLFHEIFGDLETNVNNWTRSPLGKLATRVNVGYVGPTSKWYRNEGVPFLRTQNVGNLAIRRDEIKHIAPEFHNQIRKSQLKTGDIIISRVISDEINCAIVPPEFEGANCANIVIVTPGPQLDSYFLAILILAAGSQNKLVGVSVGSAQSVVNTGSFKKWVIPVPPLALQKEFASRVAEIRAIQSEQAASRRSLNKLFSSLLDRAFKGEI